MDRAQGHTLEAIIAALVLLTSVIFIIQITSVTPLSASTSSQHIENQLQASAEGVLSTAATHGELTPAVLFWNNQTAAFHNTSGKYYYTRFPPPNAFGERLERAFGDRGIAYNVYVNYDAGGGSPGEDRLVYRGAPSDNAVTASRSIVLTEVNTLYDATGHPSGVHLNDSNFYAPDVGIDSPVYNVIQVEVVVWRI